MDTTQKLKSLFAFPQALADAERYQRDQAEVSSGLAREFWAE